MQTRIHSDTPQSVNLVDAADQLNTAIHTVSAYVSSLSVFDRRKENEIREILDCLAADTEDAEDRAKAAVAICRNTDEKLDRIASAVEILKSDIHSLQYEVSRLAELIDHPDHAV